MTVSGVSFHYSGHLIIDIFLFLCMSMAQLNINMVHIANFEQELIMYMFVKFILSLELKLNASEYDKMTVNKSLKW